MLNTIFFILQIQRFFLKFLELSISFSEMPFHFQQIGFIFSKLDAFVLKLRFEKFNLSSKFIQILVGTFRFRFKINFLPPEFLSEYFSFLPDFNKVIFKNDYLFFFASSHDEFILQLLDNELPLVQAISRWLSGDSAHGGNTSTGHHCFITKNYCFSTI